MTLGRSTSGAIKLKTDEAGGGLRAVECACCGGAGYYSGGGYICSDGSIHPILGPQVDYWAASAYHSILEDGSVSYVAEAWSVSKRWKWIKTTPAGSPVDYQGVWTPDPDWWEPSPAATFTLLSDDPRCAGASKPTLNFNVQIPVWNYYWTDDGMQQCAGPSEVLIDVFACWVT